LLLASLATIPGCGAGGGKEPAQMKSPSSGAHPPIEDVISRQAARLLSLDGVVGVYQGALDDGRPCITIAVAGLTPELRAALPETLEGHPVTLQETGEIGPH
jgi:hypothetical protein